MGKIPEETIEAVTAATDIVELIAKYIPVKRAGSQFKALCPFHNERTPSFSISPQRQAFHCFGCGESGSAIGFVMKYENLPFTDAVKKLAEAAGIPIIEDAYDPKEDKRRRHRSRLIELHNQAAEFMHQMLMKSPDAAHGRAYLKSRGFDGEMAKRWKLGWMPENPQLFIKWAKEQGFKGRELVDGSLAGLRDEGNPSRGIFVRFSNRLMIPIHNDYGDIIAFTARQLIEDKNSGKYINSNQTMIFDKSKTLFGLDKARRFMTKENFALVCEGQLDVISCIESGVGNTIGTQGTALTEDHARLLKRYTHNAVLCFDADGAGIKAVEKAFRVMVPQGINVKVVKMPQGADPDSLIKEKGVEAFRELIRQASDFFDFQFEIAKESIDLRDIQQRTVFSNKMAELISLVSDKVTKDALIQLVAGRLNIGAEEFREAVIKGERKKKFAKNYDYKSSNEPQEVKVEPSELEKSVGNLCFYALYDPSAMDYLAEQLESLIEPLKHLHGGNILMHILARRPSAGEPASIQTYLLSLPEADQLALSPYLAQQLPGEVLQAAQDTSSLMLNGYLQKREAAIRAMMKRSDLAPEQMNQLMLEVQEIAKLLKGVSQRFIR